MTEFTKEDFPPLPTRTKGKGGGASGDRISTLRVPCNTGSFATISDLPDELILSIIHYLPGIDLENFQLASLVNLSRTNRYFHCFVADKLYASYNSHFCEPYLFYRTVISNKHLAEFVQHVEITCGELAHSERERYVANAQDKKIIKEGLKALNIPNWKVWATDCNAKHAELDTLYTAILMQTPNVSSIKARYCTPCNYPGYKTPKWIDLFRRVNAGASVGHMHRFEGLKSLVVEIEQITAGQLAPIFRLPTLLKLHLKSWLIFEGHNERTVEEVRHTIPQSCNTLRELHLENTNLRMDILGILIASAQNLKALNVKMDLDDQGYDVDEVLAISSSMPLVTALQSQKDSLESLFIDIDLLADISYFNAFHLHEGLQDFSKLKKLSCPIGSLALNSVGTSAISIPPSVETLHITIRRESQPRDQDFIPALEDLADTYTSRELPNLKTIRITIDYASPAVSHDWSRLMASLSRSSIDLVVEIEPVPGDEFSGQWNDKVDSSDSSDDTSTQSSDEVSLYSHPGDES